MAQYPYLLGDHLRIADGAAPAPTLWVLTVVAAALLFALHQSGRLDQG